jgi:hypothetical protein
MKTSFAAATAAALISLLGCSTNYAMKNTPAQLQVQMADAQNKKFTAAMRFRGCLEGFAEKRSVTEDAENEIADGAAVFCNKFADAYTSYSTVVEVNTVLSRSHDLSEGELTRQLEETKRQVSFGLQSLQQQGRSETIELVMQLRSHGQKDQSIFKFPER